MIKAMAYLMARINTLTSEIIEYRILSEDHPEVRGIGHEAWACIASYHKAPFHEASKKLQPLLETLEKVRPKSAPHHEFRARTVVPPSAMHRNSWQAIY